MGQQQSGLARQVKNRRAQLTRRDRELLVGTVEKWSPELQPLLSILGQRELNEAERESLRGDAVDTSGLPPGTRPGQSIGPKGMTIRLSAADFTLLRNALVEVTKGVEIPEWEFPIRLGATVAEGKQLLAEIEGLIRDTAA